MQRFVKMEQKNLQYVNQAYDAGVFDAYNAYFMAMQKAKEEEEMLCKKAHGAGTILGIYISNAVAKDGLQNVLQFGFDQMVERDAHKYKKNTTNKFKAAFQDKYFSVKGSQSLAFDRSYEKGYNLVKTYGMSATLHKGEKKQCEWSGELVGMEVGKLALQAGMNAFKAFCNGYYISYFQATFINISNGVTSQALLQAQIAQVQAHAMRAQSIQMRAMPNILCNICTRVPPLTYVQTAPPPQVPLHALMQMRPPLYIPYMNDIARGPIV